MKGGEGLEKIIHAFVVNNNVNPLAQAGNMTQMLAKLDRLIDLTERNGNVSLTFEDLVN